MKKNGQPIVHPISGTHEWRWQAACLGADPVLFETTQRSGRARRIEIETTIAEYCHQCPVIQECGRYGRETHSVGIWGGEFFNFVSDGKWVGPNGGRPEK